jgi:hypothetical protein
MTVLGYIRRREDMKNEIKQEDDIESHMKNLGVMDAGKTEARSTILKTYTKTGEKRERWEGAMKRLN